MKLRSIALCLLAACAVKTGIKGRPMYGEAYTVRQDTKRNLKHASAPADARAFVTFDRKLARHSRSSLGPVETL